MCFASTSRSPSALLMRLIFPLCHFPPGSRERAGRVDLRPRGALRLGWGGERGGVYAAERRGETGVDAALPSLIPLRCRGSLKGADQGCRMLFFKPHC